MRRVGRDREKNKRMPKGWAPAKSGAIYFRPTNAGDVAIVRAITGGALSIKLGDTVDEAAETFARVIIAARAREDNAAPGTVAEIVERARREFLPSIANAKTRKERERHLDALLAKFGARHYARNVFEASRDSAGRYLRAMDVQRHIFEGRTGRAVSVNREVRTWELAFIWARAPWGLTEYNPCAGLQHNEEAPRDVLPADGDIFKLYRHLDPPARFMVALNRFYGRRKVEALGLTLSDARDDGLHLRRGKRAKEIIIRWDTRLRKMLARVMRWRAEVIRPTKGNRKAPAVVELSALLLNRRGRRYTVTGFNSARKRAMERAGIAGAFTFHDLRAARASTLSPAMATEVLAHDDPRTTSRIYRRGASIVDLADEVNARRGTKKTG